MKMVKSLLLGSAAGLVAIAGAQAADLPVKAKPVQYVKICSLYGVGFYYIPGTDMCIKVGGWARIETAWGTNSSSTGAVANGDVNLRSTSMWWWRTRGYVTMDARNQTPYGTVRAYLDIGYAGDNAVAAGSNRGFIQWAGFTFGLTQSFYDFYSAASVGYNGWAPSEDTGDGGNWVIGYTAQFGNGLSATIAAEVPRSTQIIDINSSGSAITSTVNSVGAVVSKAATAGGLAGLAAICGNTVGGTTSASCYGGLQAPDVVGNLRIDQTWGSAQVMGAWHLVNATYYNPGNTTLVTPPGGGFVPLAQNQWSGHPSDESGWVLGAGLRLNAPMIGKGDYFQAEANYTKGALKYLATSQGGGNYYIEHGQGVAYGILSDGVYGGGIGTASNAIQLTTGWSVNASYEHNWNDQWKTSIYGGYLDVSYNAQANAALCFVQGFGTAAGVAAGVTDAVGCNNDWNFWHIGSRTQWNVTPDFYMGVDVLYGQLHSATTPTGFTGVNTASASSALSTPAKAPLAGSGLITSEDILSVRFRVHKDFYP